MSEHTKLKASDDRLEARIRDRAHKIWVDEGRPQGREKHHWELARLAIAEEDGQSSALQPPEVAPPEPIEALSNQGEFPTLTDQGEAQIPETPKESRKSERGAARKRRK